MLPALPTLLLKEMYAVRDEIVIDRTKLEKHITNYKILFKIIVISDNLIENVPNSIILSCVYIKYVYHST